VTFALMQSAEGAEIMCFLDPSDREEAVMKGRVSFSVNAHNEICSMHKLGGSPVSSKYIMKLADLAIQRASDVHVWLGKELEAADKKAEAERTRRLRGKDFKGHITVAGKAMKESSEAAAIQHLGYNQLNISCATREDDPPPKKQRLKENKKGTKKSKAPVDDDESSEEEGEGHSTELISDFA
jgi:hypothetical protein